MSQSPSPLSKEPSNNNGPAALKSRLAELFPDSRAHIERCFETPLSSALVVPPAPAGAHGVPMRVYFKTALAAAHSAYNTVAVTQHTSVRDVVKLLAQKNKFLPLEAKFALILWKRSADGVIEEQYLRDSERPANLLALWKSKGESDSTRRFYLYFSESVSAGLSRPEPYVPLDASGTGSTSGVDDDDNEHHGDDGGAHSPRKGLSTLRRLVSGGKTKSRSKSPDTGAAADDAKSPPTSPRAPPRALSPGIANSNAAKLASSAAPVLSQHSAAPNAGARAAAKPNRSLTEAAVLKGPIESPYRTIPTDLWSDASEHDTAPATAAPAAMSSPSATSDMLFLEELLNQPIAGGVDDLRALEAAGRNGAVDDDDDDGFRMSLIDRPNDEFLKTIKLTTDRTTDRGVQAAPAKAAAAPKPTDSVEYDADTLDKLAASWLEAGDDSKPAAAAAAPSTGKMAKQTAVAAIDDMLAGLDDNDGGLQLQAISAPPEVDDSAYCQIPKGLSRPSFLKPAGHEPQVFTAKVQRIASQRSVAPVETEPALEDADELLAELAADENVQRAMSTTQELDSWRASVHVQAAPAAVAPTPIAADEWDFELDLEKAQAELASDLAQLSR